MARYRVDRVETVETALGSQGLGYCDWLGGPTLTKVENVDCLDGKCRTWFKTGEPDTYFSVPGYVHHASRKVQGFISFCDETESYHFHADQWRENLPDCFRRSDNGTKVQRQPLKGYR